MSQHPPEELVEKLRAIRGRTDIRLKPNPYLRDSITGRNGTEVPFSLRGYQVQMVLHLQAMPRFVVGDDTGCGKCQSVKGSLILTNRGFLRPDDIENWSDMAPDTFKPLSRPLSVLVGGEARPVRSFYYGGRKPTLKIVSRYGYEIEGTKVHPLMIRRDEDGAQWIKTSDIHTMDYACIERKLAPFPSEDPEFLPVDLQGIGANARGYEVPTRLNPDLSRLLGYIVAEGWTNNRSKFLISQCPILNPDIMEDIKGLLRTQLGYTVLDSDNPSMVVNSVFLREYLKVAGIPDVLSAAKGVPWCVLQGTRESVREFLRGYFEGDGSVRSGVEVISASEELLRQVQLLLLQFGIVGRRAPKRIKGNDHTYWRLTIFGDNARLFKDRIGFVSERKSEALALVLAKKPNGNHDVVPHACGLVEALRAEIYSRAGLHGFKGTGIVKRWGVSFFNTLSHVRAGRRDPTYSFLRRMLEVAGEVGASDTPACAAVRAVVDRDFFYDPVVSIEAGEDDVFDIEVDHPEHAFVGNGFVNHNTVETIGGLCCLWAKDPGARALVLTKKSAVRQWSAEFAKYTQGVRIVECRGTPEKREKALKEYLEGGDPSMPSVLIMGHRSLVQDFRRFQNIEWGVTVVDEVTVAKTPGTQLHKVIQHVCCTQSFRAWGLTATLIKNHLVEGYGIYKVIAPQVFPVSQSKFVSDFCLTRRMQVGKGRYVDQIIGYSRSAVERFRKTIEPYYLGRPKHEIAAELPPLTTRVVKVGLSDIQRSKYAEALTGFLEVGTGEVKEVSMLTAVTYCQEIANHPGLIDCDGESEKLDELVDMLIDGDLSDDKVIVFTRFEKMVGIGVAALEAKGIRCARITGRENEDQRKAAQDIFQDVDSEVRVVWITTAGSDAINLQAAKAIVFYDTPFSAGDLLQVLGRMIRIGSAHDRVLAIHLVCEKTVDERVMEIIQSKMDLIEAVIGKRLKEDDVGDQSMNLVVQESALEQVYRALCEDAKEVIGARRR